MTLDPSMQQVVEVALNILPTTHLTPDEILDQIADYVRAKRNIALDREWRSKNATNPTRNLLKIFTSGCGG
jgi:hypothetical protein